MSTDRVAGRASPGYVGAHRRAHLPQPKPARPAPGPARRPRPSAPAEQQPEDGGAAFGALLGHREFRAMWWAIGQSQFGDQVGRVALSVLVFTSTGSGAATAAVYALTYLPALVGGLTLSGLADRLPRRSLLVGCDLLRAALFAAMAVPAVPVGAVAGLLSLAVLIGAPHKAAEPAVVADMFVGDRYTAALALRTATVQTAQLAGFALGGVLVGAIGTRASLALDAATFALSAVLLRIFLHRRPAPAPALRGGELWRGGLRVVFGDPRLRALVGLAWLAGCWAVPEGLAAPYAAAHGGGAASTGMLLAADPVGALIGSLFWARSVPAARRPVVLGPLAITTGIPLLACAGGPAVPVAFALWAAAGALSAYQVLVVAEFVGLTPTDRRGQAIGVASSGLIAVQGAGILAGGGLSAALGTAPAIAVAGAVGTVLAVAGSRAWQRARVGASRQT